MKKITNYILIPICFVALLFTACKKDYITGGVPEDVKKYANISTYEFLSDTSLYDTLVQVIDAAGLKDVINSSNTFFAPSDYSIYTYLYNRTIYVQNNIDVNGKFGLDSLLYYVKNNINNTRDSLLMYLIDQPISYDDLTDVGEYYKTELGNKVILSYEETFDTNLGYNSLLNPPQVVYFTQVWYPYDLSEDSPAGDIPSDVGVHTLVKRSGIQTKNGIVNELDNSHTLFFYGTKQ